MESLTSGAKARVLIEWISARLKSCPFKANAFVFRANGFRGGTFAQLAGKARA